MISFIIPYLIHSILISNPKFFYTYDSLSLSLFPFARLSLYLLHGSFTFTAKSPVPKKKAIATCCWTLTLNILEEISLKFYFWAIMFPSFCICDICEIFIETALFIVAIQLQFYNHPNKCYCLQDNSAILVNSLQQCNLID